MQRHSKWNRDYHDLNEAEVNHDRAIERLEEVLERNPNNDEAKEMLADMKAAKGRFPDVLQALLE